MAKVTGSRVAVDVARDAIQVHGGYGFVRQLTADGKTNHLESIWRDSKVGENSPGRQRGAAVEHRPRCARTRHHRLTAKSSATSPIMSSWPPTRPRRPTSMRMPIL